MSFVDFITRRYIFSGRRFQFISLISWLSVIGIIIGVASLVLVMSIFNGFREMQKEQLLGLDPHLEIYSIDSKIYSYLSKKGEVKRISYASEKKVLIGFGEANSGAKLIVYNNDEFLSDFRKRIQSGIYDTKKGLIAGGILANKLKFFPGDSIRIITPEQIKQSIVSYRNPAPREELITGLFYTNIKNYDNFYLFGSQNEEITENDEYSSIVCNLSDPKLASKLKDEIIEIFPDVEISSWQDKNSQILGIMEFERYATFIILSLIILIAAFNLFVSISMTVLEKEKDIAIIKVLGATKESIGKIFFRVGFYTGSVGTLIGLVIGLVGIYTQIRFGWIPVANSNNVVMPDVPIKADKIEIAAAIFLSLGLTAISSSLPGRYILNRKIISGLRGDN